MKASQIFTTGLISSVNAVKHMEIDVLAAKGMQNLRLHVEAAKNGSSSPQTCTLENAAVRREWSVDHSAHVLLLLNCPGLHYQE